MSNLKTIFICERPLQILIAHAIITQLDCIDCIEVCIAGTFNNSKKLFQRIMLEKLNSKINYKYFNKYSDAFKYAVSSKGSEVFIHWDVGFRMSLQLSLMIWINKLKINIYEEGVGTYKNSIFMGIKKFLFLKAGVSVNCGGHKSTQAIYVYKPSEYKKNAHKAAKSIIKINESIDSFLEKNRSKLEYIFDASTLKSKILKDRLDSCTIYMTNYEINMVELDGLQRGAGRFIVKPHPHMMADIRIGSESLICNNEIPAELLIDIACNHYKQVRVIHFGSSVERYINRDNSTFINRM